MPSGPAYDLPLERLRNGKNPLHRPLKPSFCQLLLPTYDITFGTVVVVVVVVVVYVHNLSALTRSPLLSAGVGGY